MLRGIFSAVLAVALLAGCDHARAQEGYQGGAYAGLTAGYSAAVLGAEDVKLGDAGAMGGAYARFMYHVNPNFVAGIEADITLADVKTAFTDANVSIQASSAWTASLRARAGMPVGPALLYATGGVAVRDSKLKDATSSDREYLVGLALGAGLELELTRTLLVRIEGIHYSFDSKDFELQTLDLKSKAEDTVFRVGVAVKLF